MIQNMHRYADKACRKRVINGGQCIVLIRNACKYQTHVPWWNRCQKLYLVRILWTTRRKNIHTMVPHEGISPQRVRLGFPYVNHVCRAQGFTARYYTEKNYCKFYVCTLGKFTCFLMYLFFIKYYVESNHI